MKTKGEIDFENLQGLHWHKMGQSSFTGSLLELFKDLDQYFLRWAAKWKAQEYYFPPFLSAAQMQKLDYFKSFPHLITIPVVLDDAQDNLKAFSEKAVNPQGSILLTQLSDVRQVLTPAACYHFYDELEGSNLHQAKFVTTRCVCYRREKQYTPLQRQWAFSMREIVCLGGAEEVKTYLAEFEDLLQQFFQAQGLPVKFEYATDPFFNPASNPKYLMQKLDPVKKEMIYDGQLSIGSLNFHRSFFGETFSIKQNETPVNSACVAFGLERWMYMMVRERGIAPEAWTL
ncbi:MAG: hypothetical protein K2X77_22025 [Candidatus Obscuribacterales bacterium]|nr:hypothetical protein [Candidatus Obscuribacterales bacterium]